MRTFDFDESGIRSWLNHGMVTLPPPNAPTVLKQQAISCIGTVRTGILFIALTMGINISALAQTVNLPNQSASVCSHAPEPGYLTKKALLESLKSIASLGDNWQGQDTPAPSRQAVTAAEQIVPALPNIIADVSAGVDGDGNVFFKLQKGDKLAYLTIESATMHLLVMAPGRKNLYIDDVKFQPRQLPSKIRQSLEQEMAG